MSSEKGQSSAFIIIFIVVIVFAVMVSGGGASLFSGNEASPDLATDTPEPTAGPTSPNVAWDIAVNLTGCKIVKEMSMTGSATVAGPTGGYIVLKVQNGSTTNLITNPTFTSPSTIYNLILPNSDSFNSNPWSIELYSGGSSGSGGTLQKTYKGNPTGCPNS